MVKRNKGNKQRSDYWDLAKNSGDVIATWPKWKQDYHHYKKSIRHGLVSINNQKTKSTKKTD